jgi:hypothetical protein
MKLAQVQALFLLANLEIIQVLPIDNQYDSCGERSKLNPWWLVTTPKGVVVIGWRSRVISIEWSDTGVVFPLIDPEGRDLHSFRHPINNNTTKWPTGGHAYGYGEAVNLLTALKHAIDSNDYLKEYWPANPDREEEKVEWLITAERKRWVKSDTEDDKLEVTIATKHKSHAIVEFHKMYPNHEIRGDIWLKAVIMEERKKHEEIFGSPFAPVDVADPIAQELIDQDESRPVVEDPKI